MNRRYPPEGFGPVEAADRVKVKRGCSSVFTGRVGIVVKRFETRLNDRRGSPRGADEGRAEVSRADDIKRGIRVSEKRTTKRQGDVDWREGYEPRHGDVLRCRVRGDEYQQSYVAVYRDYVGDGVGAYWACDGTEIHEETPIILFEAVEILYRRPR